MSRTSWIIGAIVLVVLGVAAYWWATSGTQPAPATASIALKPTPVAQAKPVAAKAPSYPARPTACVVDLRKNTYWRHFGARPFASSIDEAMATREAAFTCLDKALRLPKGFVLAAMTATTTAGQSVETKDGDRLAGMVSRDKDGTIRVERNVRVKFDRPKEKGMAFAAIAHDWVVDVGGYRITVRVHDVCGNWTVVAIQPVRPKPVVRRANAAPPAPQCVEVTSVAPPGGAVIFSLRGKGIMPPSACYAYWFDDGQPSALVGLCPECDGLAIPVPEAAKRITIRLPEAIWDHTLVECLRNARGQRSCGVYLMPADQLPSEQKQLAWNHRSRIAIPDADWRMDNGSCPNLP